MRRAFPFVFVAAELALVLAAAYLFHIQEGFGFPRLLPLVFLGFLIHAALPERLKGPFRVLLFFIGAFSIYGLRSALFFSAAGAVLLGICHLPARLRFRAAFLACVAAASAFCRIGRPPWISDRFVIPILASMFMFRILLYIYEHRTDPQLRVPFWRRLGYFYMLPNICFPLFPVVDYRTYLETYYNEDALRIYRKGISWMTLGLSHLLLYRLIYFYCTPVPFEVQSGTTLLLYVVTAYLMYLRVSGQFHFIVGILALFGHNLPATHRFYFFASDFADYWRRVNIYWKDFMSKLFYYPVLLWAGRAGRRRAYALSVISAFLVTWLLHSYQWFWIRGRFPIEHTDMLFWGVLGCGMLVQTLWQTRRGATAYSREENMGKAVRYAVRMVAMFCLLSVLWSVWSADSIGEWIGVMRQVRIDGGDWARLAAMLVGAVAIVAAVRRVIMRRPSLAKLLPHPMANATFCAILILFAFLPPDLTRQQSFLSFVPVLRDDSFNLVDEALMLRGYYNEILQGGAPTARFWEGPIFKPREWILLRDTEFATLVKGLLGYELLPSKRGIFHGVVFETNEWGMRDKPLTLPKPAGTYRIAFLGASYVIGSGVDSEDDFESVIERKLNRDYGLPGRRTFEALNFGACGYYLLKQAVVLEKKAIRFAPDAALFMIHEDEESTLFRQLAAKLSEGAKPEFAFIRRLQKLSGAVAGLAPKENVKRLMRFRRNIMRWTLHEVAAACRRRGIRAAVAYLPTLKGIRTEKTRQELDAVDRYYRDLARRAGLRYWSLDDAFRGYERRDVEIAPWDGHPNKLGHLLIARILYAYLSKNAAAFSFGTT